MADVTPPTPPHPKVAAKGLAGVFKGKPTWVWVAGVTVLIGVAYMVRRRAASNAVPDSYVQDTTTGAVGDSSLYPSASQGAFGGYSDFSSVPTDQVPADNAGTPEQPQAQPINIYLPGITSDPGQTMAAASPTAAITGGGTQPARSVAAHTSPVKRTAADAIAQVIAVATSQPAVKATATQQQAQAKALTAAPTAVFIQDAGSRSGLNYKVIAKNGKHYRYYESRPGKGDWGEGGKVLIG